VPSKCRALELAAPTFVIIKDRRVCWVADFRELDKLIKGKTQHSLPWIMEILRKRHSCKCFSKIDICMQCCAFDLDDASKDLCVIATPVGKFKHNCLPMGIKQTPDFEQETMEDVLKGIKCDV
jgi:hypothetical protein